MAIIHSQPHLSLQRPGGRRRRILLQRRAALKRKRRDDRRARRQCQLSFLDDWRELRRGPLPCQCRARVRELRGRDRRHRLVPRRQRPAAGGGHQRPTHEDGVAAIRARGWQVAPLPATIAGPIGDPPRQPHARDRQKVRPSFAGFSRGHLHLFYHALVIDQRLKPTV